jgi:hypothetical protein
MDWDLFFKEEKEKEYFINLMDYLKTEYENIVLLDILNRYY